MGSLKRIPGVNQTTLLSVADSAVLPRKLVFPPEGEGCRELDEEITSLPRMRLVGITQVEGRADRSRNPTIHQNPMAVRDALA